MKLLYRTAQKSSTVQRARPISRNGKRLKWRKDQPTRPTRFPLHVNLNSLFKSVHWFLELCLSAVMLFSDAMRQSSVRDDSVQPFLRHPAN